MVFTLPQGERTLVPASAALKPPRPGGALETVGSDEGEIGQAAGESHQFDHRIGPLPEARGSVVQG